MTEEDQQAAMIFDVAMIGDSLAQVKLALQMAGGDPDRAVELLVTGALNGMPPTALAAPAVGGGLAESLTVGPASARVPVEQRGSVSRPTGVVLAGASLLVRRASFELSTAKTMPFFSETPPFLAVLQVRFLLEHMGPKDLASLQPEFVLEHVEYAHRAAAKAAARWGASAATDTASGLFLDNVLPYCSINERRDSWRKDFHDRFWPAASAAACPAAAVVALNSVVFAADRPGTGVR